MSHPDVTLRKKLRVQAIEFVGKYGSGFGWAVVDEDGEALYITLDKVRAEKFAGNYKDHAGFYPLAQRRRGDQEVGG
jgi:hypothetical protein